MAPTTFDDLQLPETKLYRVRGIGANYVKPQKVVGGDGQPTVAYVASLASGGQIIDLIAPEAERLLAIGAVVEAEAPKGYDELTRAELEILATQRGVVVRSTSADPEQPLDDDYRNALALFDLGSDTALVGVSSTPGGVVQTSNESGAGPVLVDGVHPNPATEQDAETSAVEEARFADRGSSASGGFDARGKSATDVAAWLDSEKPNASATVAAANGDPDAAATVIEAERTARQGDPRETVVRQLQKVADGGSGA